MAEKRENYDVSTFITRLEDFHLSLTEKQIHQFLSYYELLVEWNQKMNLTAITGFDEVIHKHFVDSISFSLAASPKEGQTLIDVGTGAGFPGIPLKIIYPHLEITLLDSLNKRITFLNEVISVLQLEKISAVHGRAEDTAHDSSFRAKYDYCVSRAVSNISTLSEYCIPFLKKGGYLISYKGGEVEEELRKYIFGIRKMYGTLEKAISFSIPMGEESLDRTLLVIRKEKETPSKYPRKAGTPAKKPL